MARNLVGEQRLTLRFANRNGAGNVLTVPEKTLSAVINIVEGSVHFTLDASKPSASTNTIAYQGQHINISDWEQMQSIVKQLRIITTDKQAKIVAWYFD